jgi:hypothetical protein
MRMSIVAAIAAATLGAGCSVDSSVLQTAIVMQSAYDPMPCPEVVQKYKSSEGRMKELAALMEKSGSPVANAIAYDTEYATVRANWQFSKEAAERKGCDLTGKGAAPAPVAKPPEATSPTDLLKSTR